MADITRITRLAAEVGCHTVWYSEVNGYDAVALSTAMVSSRAAGTMDVTVGPLPLGVRDPALLAQGIAVLEEHAPANVSVALGSSSRTVVEEWHGRSSGDPVSAMEAYLPAFRTALSGQHTDHSGVGWQSRGFRLNVDPPGPVEIIVAALGDRMLQYAGKAADGVVINLVTPDIIPPMRKRIMAGAEDAGRAEAPRLIAWLVAGSTEHALPRVARMLGAYTTAPGYRRRLYQAGVLEGIDDDPESAAVEVGAFGLDPLRERIDQFHAAGIDELAVVVSGADPLASDIVELLTSVGSKGAD